MISRDFIDLSRDSSNENEAPVRVSVESRSDKTMNTHVINSKKEQAEFVANQKIQVDQKTAQNTTNKINTIQEKFPVGNKKNNKISKANMELKNVQPVDVVIVEKKDKSKKKNSPPIKPKRSSIKGKDEKSKSIPKEESFGTYTDREVSVLKQDVSEASILRNIDSNIDDQKLSENPIKPERRNSKDKQYNKKTTGEKSISHEKESKETVTDAKDMPPSESSPIFPVKPMRRRHQRVSSSQSPNSTRKADLKDLEARTLALLNVRTPSPDVIQREPHSSSDDSVKQNQHSQPTFKDSNKFPILEKCISQDSYISSSSPEPLPSAIYTPRKTVSPEPQLDEETTQLLERSQLLHMKKQEFMRDRLAGNNPYLKRMLEREDRGSNSTSESTSRASSKTPHDNIESSSSHKSMFGFGKKRSQPSPSSFAKASSSSKHGSGNSQASNSSNKDTNCVIS